MVSTFCGCASVSQPSTLQLLYGDDDQVMEDVERSIRLLAEIEESMQEACHTSYVANELPRL